jgi:hypothetical protein
LFQLTVGIASALFDTGVLDVIEHLLNICLTSVVTFHFEVAVVELPLCLRGKSFDLNIV